MIRFNNCTLNDNISHAIKQVERLLTEESSMIKELKSKNDWQFNSGSAENVVSSLLKTRDVVDVYTYRSINPFSKAVGYYDGEAIHINLNRIKTFNFEDLCGLLLHEYSHHCNFKHDNNFKTKQKCLYSVPYFLSENVTRWV